MKRFGLILILLAYAPVTLAYSVSMEGSYVVKWPYTSLTYYLQQDGVSTINNGSDLNAIRDAVSSWNAVSCANLNIIEASTIASRSTVVTSQSTDGKNVLTWLEDSSWNFGSYVLGVTMPVYDSYGTINEADIVFNGYNIICTCDLNTMCNNTCDCDPDCGNSAWSTTSSSIFNTDIESVTVHELGHFFGAQHVIGGESMAEPPTMAPSILPDLQSRTLSPDDQKGVCFLYPESTYACSTIDDCPNIINPYDQYAGQLACENNACAGVSEATGNGTLGDSCVSSGDCSASYFCQPTSDGSRYCTQDCNPNISGSCPSGFECYAYANAAGGACLPDGSSSSSSSSGGSTTGETAYGCTCDLTTICDGSCHCDPECHCDCDLTTICDDSCGCDPECNAGCALLGAPTESKHPSTWLFLCILGTSIFILRRKSFSKS